MSCCGNKRNSWISRRQFTPGNEKEIYDYPGPVVEKPPKVFEYTGNTFLTIEGLASGHVHSFRYKGHCIEVEYHDSFAMMAERELVVWATEMN